MKRKEHEAEIRQRILKATQKLFYYKGYHKTTIRQITKEAGVKIGTLYHFYADKEAIFFNIVMELLDKVIRKADNHTPNNQPFLALGLEISFHLDNILRDERYRELYLVAHNSKKIANEILNKRIIRMKQLFQKESLNLSSTEQRGRAMMLNGFFHSILIEVSNYPDRLHQTVIETSLQLIFNFYNISQKDIDTYIQTSLNVLFPEEI